MTLTDRERDMLTRTLREVLDCDLAMVDSEMGEPVCEAQKALGRILPDLLDRHVLESIVEKVIGFRVIPATESAK